MSGRANLGRATDHRNTVQSGYSPIGLLSFRVTVSWTTIPRTNVPSGCCQWGYCLSGYVLGEVSVGLVFGRATVRESFFVSLQACSLTQAVLNCKHFHNEFYINFYKTIIARNDKMVISHHRNP